MTAYVIEVSNNPAPLTFTLTPSQSGKDGQGTSTAFEFTTSDTVAFKNSTGAAQLVISLASSDGGSNNGVLTPNTQLTVAQTQTSAALSVASVADNTAGNALTSGFAGTFFADSVFYKKVAGAATPTTPTSITFGSDPGTESATVSITATAGGGTNGTMTVSETSGSGFVANGSSFTFTRNTPKTIYARTEGTGSNSPETSSSYTAAYLLPDRDVNFSVDLPSISSGYTGNVILTVTNGSAGNMYRALRTTGGNAGMGNTGYLSGTTTGTVTIGDAAGELPPSGSSFSYTIQARRAIYAGGDNATWYNTSPLRTFTITRTDVDPVATPTSFSAVDATTSGQTYPQGTGTTINLSADALSGHTLEFRVDGGTWSATSSYAHTFGAERVYEARYVRTSDSATSTTPASITRKVADVNITISPVTSITAANSTNPLKIADIGGATADTQYRARATGNINGSSVTNLVIDSPIAAGANPDINAANPTELPAENTSATYTIMARVRTNENGDGNYRQLPTNISNRSWTLTRQADTAPNPFSFSDVTGASRSTYQVSSVQITGMTPGVNVTASVTQNDGNGEFAVDSNSTAPSSGYSATSKNIQNGQYLHARVLSSNTLGASVSSTFTVGGISDNFNVTTTNDAADLTVNIIYVPEDLELSIPAFLNITSSPPGFTTDAGNVVRFAFASINQGITSLSISSLNLFTNNSEFTVNNGSNTTRTLLSSASPASVDVIQVETNGDDAISDSFNIIITPLDPDISISAGNVTMSSDATTWSVTITEESPNENSSVTTYEVRDGSTTIGTRLGPGTIGPISGYVPSFLGIPDTYAVYGKVLSGNGGTGGIQLADSFTVTRGTPPPPVDPVQNTYGIGIYDNTGTLVTTFAEGSTILRKVYSGSATTSTTACTEIATGLYSLSAGNSFVLISSDNNDSNPEGFKSLPYTIKSGSTIVLARELYQSTDVDVAVIQTKGPTISNATSPDYGIEIFNEEGELVVDDLAECYAVREIIDCSGATVFGGSYSLFDITLVENRYPFSAGPPIPALKGPPFANLVPPTLLVGASQQYTSSYKTVRVILPGTIGSASGYEIAMLVNRESNPVYYGGSASDYGIQVENSSGQVTWDSSWRQGIINNIVPVNQFTFGTTQNGTYDVVSGTDGVLAPIDGVGQMAELSFGTSTTGQSITVNNLNIMDPTNTFLLGGGLVTGKVRYYRTYVDGELGQVETPGFKGGGVHTPAVSITSESAVVITMVRAGDGPLPPQQNPNGDPTTWGTRVADSTHPDGFYIFARIT